MAPSLVHSESLAALNQLGCMWVGVQARSTEQQVRNLCLICSLLPWFGADNTIVLESERPVEGHVFRIVVDTCNNNETLNGTCPTDHTNEKE